ncbi:MAG: ATP-binding cassette domain-containing protein [Candidatus Dormibacteraeota bacterium]|nr:ATP-binding cassette domain-containing protein [Candidatus Dormibacteraeota bacterium]
MIQVEGLTKFYGERAAVVDLTFSVPRGQILGFLGPNGAGKSTTMRMLTGYIGASQGRASIAGFDVFTHSLEVRRRVGYLPELNPLYPELRVEGYLDFVCRLRGVPPARRRRRIELAIEACGLTTRRRELIGRLSKGLRQRVGLAQAMVHDPDVLILDEPTGGLDPRQTRETRDLIKQLGRGHTVILSSHVLSEVQATCDRVVIIDEGHLVADDTPKALSRRMGASRGQQVEVMVRGDEAAVRECLEAADGVQRVRLIDAGDGEWQAFVEGSGAELQDSVAQAIVHGGLKLRELRTRSLSLEDVFLRLTRGARSK